MSSILDTPSAWQAQLLHKLGWQCCKGLFRSSRTAARMVLQHAPQPRLNLIPRQSHESKAAAARRFCVAMRLAEGSANLEVHMWAEDLGAIPKHTQASTAALHLRLPAEHLTSLASLPLRSFKRVLLHDLDLNEFVAALCTRCSTARKAFDNLRGCKDLTLVDKSKCMMCPPPGMVFEVCTEYGRQWLVYKSQKVMHTPIIHQHGAQEVAYAMEALGLFHSQRPVVYFTECDFRNTDWMPALCKLPKCITTLILWRSQFGQASDKEYWARFAAALPAHLVDLTLQLQRYDQAVAVIEAVSGFQHPKKLWLYLHYATRDGTAPPDWWDQLSHLRKRLRPNLKLHLSDC